MAKKAVYIVGMDHLLYVLKRKAPQEFERAARQGMLKSVIDIEAETKRQPNKVPVDTGLLQSSIGHEVKTGFGEITGIVGTNVEYAPNVEYGVSPHTRTAHRRAGLSGGVIFTRFLHPGQRAQRFMQTAFRMQKNNVKPNIEAALARALKRLGF